MTSTHQNNASDPFNAALNYGYGFLEAECRMAINAVGLEPAVGFLHEFSNYQTKQSFVYDLEEPFRWLVDVTVTDVFESDSLNVHNFYFTGDDYRYRIDADARARFIDLLRVQFNSTVNYRGGELKWDTVIEQKATELSHFLIGSSDKVDFSQPIPNLERSDSLNVRRRILSLTQEDAGRIGVGKSTLHYLRKHARDERSFRVNRKVMERIEISSKA